MSDLIAMTIAFRKIAGFPHEVSACGVIRNSETGRIIKPSTSTGYEHVTLQHACKKQTFRVHRLVAELWIGPIPDGYEINHKDGNKRNNHVSNLEIVTRGENQQHAAITGLKAKGEKHGSRTRPDKVLKGADNPTAKLTDDDVVLIRALRTQGKTLMSIAKIFGVSQSLIGAICQRKLWGHIR